MSEGKTEKLEDTKGVFRNHQFKNGRQYNSQKKKDKKTNKELCRKLRIEQHEPNYEMIFRFFFLNTVKPVYKGH